MSALWNRLSSLGKGNQLGWMNDNESDSCLVCNVAFSLRIRRHHCRVCYRLVCGNCSPNNVQLSAGEGSIHRACNECCARLGSTSSSSIRQVRSALRIENSEQILLKMFVHSAKNLTSATEGGFLSASDSTRSAYCTISLNGKVVGTTSTVTSLNPNWNEFFQFKWNKHGVEMQFLVIEVWDKGRRVGGDELIGKCRVPLIRVRENKDVDIWHMLLDGAGRAHHSRVRLSLQKGIVATESVLGLSPPPPK